MPKTIKELYSDYTGYTTIEYSDDSVIKYSADDVAKIAVKGKKSKFTGVYIGDSVVTNGSNAGNGYRNSRSVLQHALRKSGRPIKIVNEVGYSGKRTDEIFANWDTAVTPYDPAFVFWESGVNDFNNLDTPEVVFARLQAVHERCVQEGRRFIYIGMPPMPYNGKYPQLLNKIRNYVVNNPTFEYVGASEALLDYNGTPYELATGKRLTNVMPDNTHPSAKGANLWGTRLAKRLTEIGLVRRPQESIMGTDTASGDYVSNPIVNGLVGSAGIGFTADVAPVGSRGIATSTQNFADNGLQSMLPGRLFRTVFTPATTPATTDKMQVNKTVDMSSGASIYAGNTFTAKSYIKAVATGGNIRGISLIAEVYDWGYSPLAVIEDNKMFDPADGTANWVLDASDYEGMFETVEFTLPSTWNDPDKLHIFMRAVIYADTGATVTVDMGCVQFQKIE